jgi:AraC-like DNA-binding protein
VSSTDPPREIHSIGRGTRESIVLPEMCPALRERRIRLAGTSEAGDNYQFQRVNPPFSQVLACLGGEGSVWLPDGWRPCTPGTAYLSPAYRLHTYHGLPSTPWKLAWVMYDEYPSEPPIIALDAPLLVQADPVPLYTAISGLFQEVSGSAQPAFVRMWTELVDACARRLVEPLARNARLWRLWEAVDSDLGRDWTLRDLAKLSGTSVEQLRLLCHKQTGSSPMQHLAKLRVRRAALLLRSTVESIEAIAWSVGYKNPFAFSTTFKRVMGMSPSTYRAKHSR